MLLATTLKMVLSLLWFFEIYSSDVDWIVYVLSEDPPESFNVKTNDGM